MKKHRSLILALGLGVMFSLSGRDANATLIITVTFGGNTLRVSSASGNAYASPGATNNVLAANTGALNSAITADGGKFQFSSLGVNSNFTGSGNGATLNLSGTVYLSGASTYGPITVTAFETGFTTPVGGGTLYNSTSGNFNDASTSDNFTGSSSLTNYSGGNPTGSPYSTTPLTVASANSSITNPGTGSGTQSVTANGMTGYQLLDSSTINLSAGGITDSSTPASTTFNVNAQFVGTAVPEPASLVMMLTGMPLPLVVMGLLRRRRAA